MQDDSGSIGVAKYSDYHGVSEHHLSLQPSSKFYNPDNVRGL